MHRPPPSGARDMAAPSEAPMAQSVRICGTACCHLQFLAVCQLLRTVPCDGRPIFSGLQRSWVRTSAQQAQNRRQEHVCFGVFSDEQIICKPPWGSVNAGFFQKRRQNHLFAGIDASPLVKRETQHKTYTLPPSRKRERRRSIYGPASRCNVRSEERFLFSQTQICKDLAWDGL